MPHELAAHEREFGHARERGGEVKCVRGDGLVRLRVEDVEVVRFVDNVVDDGGVAMGDRDGAVNF